MCSTNCLHLVCLCWADDAVWGSTGDYSEMRVVPRQSPWLQINDYPVSSHHRSGVSWGEQTVSTAVSTWVAFRRGCAVFGYSTFWEVGSKLTRVVLWRSHSKSSTKSEIKNKNNSKHTLISYQSKDGKPLELVLRESNKTDNTKLWPTFVPPSKGFPLEPSLHHLPQQY